jgi:crossover junction endodeoxyribonuclease RuvC
VQIRALGPGDDRGELFDLRIRAFGPATRDERDRWLAVAERAIADQRYLAAFEGTRMVAAAKFHDLVQSWLGASLPMAGVAAVAVAPEDRGKGIGGALISALLSHIDARGYPLSMLYPATPSLYRSAGWELAGHTYEAVLPARSLRTIAPWTGPQSPALRRAVPDDAPAVRGVHAAVHASARDCGPLRGAVGTAVRRGPRRLPRGGAGGARDTPAGLSRRAPGRPGNVPAEHVFASDRAVAAMRVLGVDPGLTRCGLGVVDGEPGRALSLAAAGVVRTPSGDDVAARLLALEREVGDWLDTHRPDAVAVERVFSQRNLRTVMGTAQAGAIAIVCAARRGIPVALHTPSEAKAAVTGSGRADKPQVTAMVTRLLRLTDPPRPADTADALALAICQLWRGSASRRLAEAVGQAAGRPGQGAPR